MRSLAFFAVGVLAATVGLWFLFPERVHFVVQVADDHAVREPPRPLEDDHLAVKLAAIDRSLADAEARRAKEAGEARERASALERQIAELRQEVAALATREAQTPTQAPAPAPAPEPAPPAAPEVVVVPVPVPVPEPTPPPPPPAPPPRALFKLIADGSKVGFDGSSSLHDFTGATTAVTGEVEFRLDQQADAPRAVVEIDARTLDTGNKSRDKDMHSDYLQTQKWNVIRFTIEKLVDLKSDDATHFHARARGTLTCHGKEKQVEAPFKAERVGATGLRIEGELPLKMTDFGITPPTAMGGLIKTHDDVRVWFVLQGRSEP